MKLKALEEFEGYLYAKLERLGTFSEGPEYYLQGRHGEEDRIVKKAELWKEDPILHDLLGERVIVYGEKTANGIVYERIVPAAQLEQKLRVWLTSGLENNTLWVNRMPDPAVSRFPPEMRSISLSLHVQWPYRSIWRGECPTSQAFDLWIEDPDGRELWQWGESMLFETRPTMIEVPGGSPFAAKVEWFFYDRSFLEPGRYKARTVFLPTGQEAELYFEVRFVVEKEAVA